MRDRTDTPQPSQDASPRPWPAVVIGAVFALGVLAEIPVLNGPWYWKWPWRDLGVFRTAFFLLPPGCVVAYVLWSIEHRDAARRPVHVLLWLAGACLAAQILALLADPRGISLVRDLVASPVATSYYTDALKIRNLFEWLGTFHEAELELHSSTHPPGPILFYLVWIKLLGAEAGAYAGGISVGVLAALGVPMVYYFAGLWTEGVRGRLHAAAWYTTLPALILFWPEFDQVYPVLAMALSLLWARSLQKPGNWDLPIMLGAVMFGATFFAYNLLTMGAFLALYAVWFATRPAPEGVRPVTAIWRATWVSVATCIGLHLLFSIATGYRPILSFLHALDVQSGHASALDRPWWPCALFDLYDFSLGAGIIAVPLVLLYVERASGHWKRQDLALTLLGLLTILIIDLTGLLRAETARVWLFLQPFLAVPAALALDRTPSRARWSAFGVQWLVLVVLKAKMSFIDP